MIKRNLERVRRRIRDAAIRAGRDPRDVELVAVTKFHSPEEIRELIDAGQRTFGESRVDELLQKVEAMASGDASAGVAWHLIGHLQTNKVNRVVGCCDLIHSVDSLRLAEAIQKRAEAIDCPKVNILLEVNVSGEESKYGLAPEEAASVARELAAFDRIRCLGLMTMAPFEDDPEATRPIFRQLHTLRDELRLLDLDHLDLRHLSMGMTNDFEVAVEEGATLVRIGTALFEE